MTSPQVAKPGYYGQYGGQFVPELLMPAVTAVAEAFAFYRDEPTFKQELTDLFNNYANRPSLLYFAKNMSEQLGGAQIYFKREDLNHTGAHKINNVLGQALLAKKMGKTRLIAETGAGQHGVATATAAALFGMSAEIFMGQEDIERQALNVYRMTLLGAKVHAVTTGTQVLKDAVNATFQDWTKRIDDTFYVLGSAVGPHPFPEMVKYFQSVISEEARAQFLTQTGRLPDAVIAAVGGGSNAIGAFSHFIADTDVQLIGVEAAGKGVQTTQTAATMTNGSEGIFHGMRSKFLQSADGQIDPVYSISAGLDYPGIGPEHAYLADIKRATYVAITDDEAVDAFEYIARTEGIVAAIESSHAVAYAMKLAPTMRPDQQIMVNLSGRGDKDVAAIARYRGVMLNE
ncbi:tryptophan synthase subunit beta [Leuconostoc lactis]|uniref:tryptophan synthase subunit beta n=2 Tax=Leuconostoc lactis TaxID=1246 RepID=UPI000814FC9B|nr:tryptophan synthase subunit beta [Leuconostoc lactis]ANY12245.1 tryptophan synthase subunit beta [Leuconostoc lactis]MBU7537059.1 tryptophan synthase subunit beta [Leuconostoc lactis]MSB65698.1 tryptophan synthase subunit beta [Leuconostoc lactis]RYS91405.1 tryptophan synthase subunit beta [Leuconostoc lactis]